MVHGPGEARQVIADGKMAVLLGIEMSKGLNCGEFLGFSECSREVLAQNLDEVYDLGVRVYFPVHKFDNAFAGHLPHSGFGLGTFLTVGNLVETLHPLEVEPCPLDQHGNDDFSERPKAGIVDHLLANLSYLFAQLSPVQSDTTHLCNVRGLTTEGYHLLDLLMQRNMIVDVDHMSRRAASAAIEYLKSFNYPMISSHDWTGSEKLLDEIADSGGFISRFMSAERQGQADRFTGMAARHDNASFFSGGMASDVNGMAALPGDPRSEDDERQISYPFTSYDGRVQFDRQVTGDRVFSLYDGRGVAHYGLYPDYLADFQQFGGPDSEQAMASFYRSAEAWLRMWERTGAQ